MQFQLRTACDKMSFPLLEAERMWQSPLFNTSKGVVILATGWTTTVNETEAIDDFAQAYNCRGDVNFVVSAVWGNLRWEENTFSRLDILWLLGIFIVHFSAKIEIYDW